MNTTKIGWIGLGNMGIPMAQQLIKAGYKVTVYNRSKEKEASLREMGAAAAASPAELLQQSEMLFIMVSDDKAVGEIFTGPSGLLSAKAAGKIIVNMSTVSPSISKGMAALSRQNGNEYLDAPVSGSVRQAVEGQLVVMVGGKEDPFQIAKPVLEHLGKLVLLVGDTGAGNIAKLAINTLLGIFAQGMAETIVFGRNHDLRTEDIITVINNSALGNVFAKIKGEAILQNNYQATFALKHIAKDLRLAKEEGLNTPLGLTAQETFQKAEDRFGKEDIIAILKQVE